MARRPSWETEDLTALRDMARAFCEKEIAPNSERYIEQHHVDRELWTKAGEVGLLCMSIPEEYGGGGGTFAHEAVLIEEQARVVDSAWGQSLHNGIVAHYILAYGSEEQKKHWLPKMASGEVVGAIAMTEPGTGSDLQSVKTKAVKDGSQMIPFVILSMLLFLAGIIFALDTLSNDRDASFISQMLKVMSILLWMWAFSFFSYQMGRFVNHYLSLGKVYVTSIVVSISTFAIVFIVHASFDLVALIFGYPHYGESFIFLMVLVGFLLAGFSGLINMNMKSFSRREEGQKEAEPLEYPEA